MVGLGAGCGAIGFRWLTLSLNDLFFGFGGRALSFLGGAYVIFIPALGGLFAGCLIYYLAPAARGFGLPEVMEAVALKGGRLRPMFSLAKVTSASICIAAGGSVGFVGPIMQVGSGLGSFLGQRLRLPDQRIRLLVACGAAGGVATTFNAPIAGVIFALEVILREFSSQSFSMVVIASVVASEIGRVYFGDFPAFSVPSYTLVNPIELCLYALLGVLAALVAVAFARMLYRTEDMFMRVKLQEYLKPGLGGLGVGVIGFLLPHVLGVGFESIELALQNVLSLKILLALLFLKTVATCLSLGSGGSGGVFAPLLFIGAVLGGSFGHGVNQLMPAITALPGAYALVGMAGVFAGAAKAPMTAVLVIFEMTRDYSIILPVMLTAVVSTILTGRLQRESVYTLKLARKGVDIDQPRDAGVLGFIRIAQAMTPVAQLVTVRPETSFDQIAKLFRDSHSHGFAVLDSQDRLQGIVALSDLERAIERGQTAGRVLDIATTDLVAAFPDDPLEEAVQKMGEYDVSRIPVVDPSNPERLLGMMHRANVIRAYTLLGK